MGKLAKVYKIENLKTKEINILITQENIEGKLKRYEQESKEGKQSEFHNAIRVHGIESFEYKEIDECIYKQRYIIEDYWVKRFIEEGKELYDIDNDYKLPAAIRQFIKDNADKPNQVNTPIKTEKPFDFQEKGKGNFSGEKNPMYGKKGEKASNGCRVVAMNEAGEVQKVFNTVGQALNFVGIKGHVGLNRAVRDETEWHGYYWKKEWINR